MDHKSLAGETGGHSEAVFLPILLVPPCSCPHPDPRYQAEITGNDPCRGSTPRALEGTPTHIHAKVWGRGTPDGPNARSRQHGL